VVWVGFDDGKDLNLEGAKSALPIWTEFMKRAHTRREYRNVRDWDAPDGIVSVDIDPASGQLATGACPSARPEYFISGTQPVEMCHLHGGGGTQVAGWETTPAPVPAAGSSPVSDQGRPYRAAQSAPSVDTTQTIPTPAAPRLDERPKEKKGFFGKIKDIFK
jgi:penicillin-binding protein 1B